jgi:CheY-like chemotaxis protein
MNAPYTIFCLEKDPVEQKRLAIAMAEVKYGGRIRMFGSRHELSCELRLLQVQEFPLVILLDYFLPELEGLLSFEEIRKWRKFDEVQLIFYGEGMTEELQSELRAAGAFFCFQRPSSIEDYYSLANKLRGIVLNLTLRQNLKGS